MLRLKAESRRTSRRRTGLPDTRLPDKPLLSGHCGRRQYNPITLKIADDLNRVERERVDADRQYNDALTALDAAAVALTAQPRDGAATGHFATALILFLQRITAFVDTKDRQREAAGSRRLDALVPALESVNEFRTQMSAVQRQVQMVTRALGEAPVATAASSVSLPVPTQWTRSDEARYVAFEDQFRGSEDSIQARLREYLPIFVGGSGPVLDLGCGRGEFLALLRAEGIAARGVDANPEMVGAARERGLDASHGDALAFLTGLPDASVGGIIATQVVEHLEPPYLMRLIETAHHKLRPGAPIVLETINPACWLAFFSSYLRDFTHVSAVHPDTLQFLLQAVGFSQVSVRFSMPVPEHVKMKPVELPAELLAATDATARAIVRTAQVANANASILNNLLFTHLDYAAIGHRS